MKNETNAYNEWLERNSFQAQEARLAAESERIARQKEPFHKGVSRVFVIRSLAA